MSSLSSTLILFTFQFPFVAIFGQISKEAFPPVVIEGRVEQHQHPEQLLDAKVFVMDFVSGESKHFAEFLDGEGPYRLEFQVPFMQDVTLEAGHLYFHLMVEPGDSIYVLERASGFEQYEAEISGDKSEINELIYAYSMSEQSTGILKSYCDTLGTLRNIQAADSLGKTFVKLIQHEIGKRKDHLNNYIAMQPKVPNLFRE